MYEQSDQLNNSSTADTTTTTTTAATTTSILQTITDNNNDNNGNLNLNLNSNNSVIGVCCEGKNFNNEHLNLNSSFNNCYNNDNHNSFTNIIDVVDDNNIELSTAVAITNITAINNKDKDNNDAIISTITTPSTTPTEMATTIQSSLIQQKMPELMLSSSSSSSPSKTVESESQTDITVTNDCDGQSIIGSSNNVVVAAVAAAAITANTDDCLTKQYNIINGNENESKNSTVTVVPEATNTIIDATTTTTTIGKIDDAIRNKNNNNKIVTALNANIVDALKKESNELTLNKLNDTFAIISKNNNCNENYINEPEMTLIEIKERMIDLENPDNEKTADSESEEDDQLKPLMTFNHTSVIDNQEYCTYHGHAHHQCMDHFESKDAFKPVDTLQDCRVSSLHHNIENVGGHNEMKNSDSKDMQQIPEIKEIDMLSPSEIPNDQLCAEIVEQVEFYFSNDSILRDAFLLKHVRRNKEGFVSLKLISSFKRVRQLTKDWRVVGHAIRRKSKKIELNDLATKIRRLEPLPSFDETMPSRTIVACDLPFEKLCIEKVSDIFSKCGEIALIRILRPGMGIPVDVRQFMNKYPEMQQKECALVEFVESHSARSALNLNDNFKVYEMVAPRKKTGKKSTSVTKMIENYKFIDHNNYERSRGGGAGTGSFNASMDNNYKYNNGPRRSFSEYYVRLDQQQPQQQQQHQHYQYQQQTQHQLQQSMSHVYAPRKYSFSDNNNKNNNNMNNNIMNNNNNNNNNISNNNSNSNMTNIMNNEIMNFGPYSPRRISTCSMGSNDHSRKYSSCSEGYSSCSELSRRTSTCSSDQSRRTSNCSDYCPCSRRSSQCSDIYRRMSQYSEHNHIINTNNNNNNNNINNNNNNSTNIRKFSSGSGMYPNSQNLRRRISMDSNYERKISTGSIGSNNGNNNNNDGMQIMHDQYRKFSNNSNGFDPNHKLSDPYYNDRRISIDSGYDRKLSFNSDYSSSPRSRSNSFLMCHQHKNIENVVRTPIGPDGSKGFTQRTRKLGQIISPV